MVVLYATSLAFSILTDKKKPYFRGLAFRSQRCFEAPWGYNATETGECQGNGDRPQKRLKNTLASDIKSLLNLVYNWL